MREKVNKQLGPSHQLDQAAFDAICDDLDENPITDRPATSTGEKQRDDGNFDHVVEEAFKAFRNLEREITLDAPDGSRVGHGGGSIVFSHSDNPPNDKFWIGAAHLRHHLEFLLVLKGIKPCVLFVKYGPDNTPLFSTVVIDCLVPIMDRLDLWSYGFSITFQTEQWVLYDTRSPKAALVKKVFDVHVSEKYMNQDEYPEDTIPGVPNSEIGRALGYPVPFDDFADGRWVHFRDNTELEALVERGWSNYVCCVQGMAFSCPPGGDESVWKKVVDLYRRCQDAARDVGSDLLLFTGKYPELTAWLEEDPSVADGLTWAGEHVLVPDTEGDTELVGTGGPLAIRLVEMLGELNFGREGLGGMDQDEMSSNLMDSLLSEGLFDFAPEEQDEDLEGSGDQS
ncbi:hypothetical protein DHEL01_v201289 [Diaporthe helianthi]|uniref:Uncharacterized protein n=1 Tax=Diaporthe helianthi TaxID=158607 RepID=A0A2P5ICV7_DIAHE|nr:hypothetical protein DHEL01_v201289 [Diaporthe helianthi]